jgi:hypothetical protein
MVWRGSGLSWSKVHGPPIDVQTNSIATKSRENPRKDHGAKAGLWTIKDHGPRPVFGP